MGNFIDASVRWRGEYCYNRRIIKPRKNSPYMKFLPHLALLLSCLLLGSGGVVAEQLKGLYEVVVPVESQSSKALRQATAQGLETVFIRVSGRQDSVRHEEIQMALGTAQLYLKQYSYRRDRNSEDGSEQLNLLLEFEQGQVDKQLRLAGLPLWSSNRPSVLVWLAIEDGDGRRIVGTELSPGVVSSIDYHATRRGLAVKMPLLDLEDTIAISEQALWNLDEQNVAEASRRYQPDTLLLGRANLLSTGVWLGAWRFSFAGRYSEFEVEASNIDTFVAEAMDWVAELLSEQYAIAPVSIAEEGIRMRLTGIQGFTDYARAVSYLESLAAIRHANVVAINGDEIVLRLVAEGQLQQLQQAIARDGRLLPVATNLMAEAVADEAIVLNYQWPGESARPDDAVEDLQ